MRNSAAINHFPPTLFSPNRSPIYGKAHFFAQPASRLVTALQLQDQLSVQLEKLHAYAAMKRDEDMRVPAAQALYQRAQTLSVKWNEESAWFQPELLRIPETQLRGWLEGADLKVYQHYFDDLLRTKAHTPPASTARSMRRTCRSGV